MWTLGYLGWMLAVFLFVRWRVERIESAGWEELTDEVKRQRDYWHASYRELQKAIFAPAAQSGQDKLSEEEG